MSASWLADCNQGDQPDEGCYKQAGFRAPCCHGLRTINFRDHKPRRIGDRLNIRDHVDAPVILPLDNAGCAHQGLNCRRTHFRQWDAQLEGRSAAVAQFI